MYAKIFSILLFITLCTQNVWGAEEVARADKISGVVHKYEEDIKNKAVLLKSGDPLFEGDLISTGQDASAFIAYKDGSHLLLKAGTELHIEQEKAVSLSKGRALFRMLKQSIKRFQVKVRNVTIGIRGTTFLAEADKDDMAIYLKEGRLNILSEEGQFERYQKREIDEFESYKEKESREFEEYKEKLEEEFIDYVKEFDMESGSAISIQGDKVRDIVISPDVEQDFELFENLGAM